MFNSTGYSLSDIAAVSGNNKNGNGGWDDSAWWIILLFMFAGGWGNGNGFGGGGRGCTQEDIRAAVDQQTLLSKLDNQTYGLADSTYALNSSIMNGFHGVDTAICNLGYQNQQGFNGLAHQLADCCCATQREIERGFCDVNYNMATQACDTRRAIADSTRDILDSNNANTRAILDFLTQDKIASLTAENQSLKFAASQAAQNAYLVNELRPCPIPAYVVANPYCCTDNVGRYNFGCGC